LSTQEIVLEPKIKLRRNGGLRRTISEIAVALKNQTVTESESKLCFPETPSSAGFSRLASLDLTSEGVSVLPKPIELTRTETNLSLVAQESEEDLLEIYTNNNTNTSNVKSTITTILMILFGLLLGAVIMAIFMMRKYRLEASSKDMPVFQRPPGFSPLKQIGHHLPS